ncbi:PAS domain-containing protein [Halomicroarcula limicola]|uniref:PAS domain-containing protein n=1 Tax=Haloarcula limicola TaxID=1429915 RepID=A0A8J7Y7X3_9EURY|nr:PAS domain-containing protein [Halomicroarcula limicola]MBV0925892.1 PAS domain-containing protein [Halomicroarcula limicola]
MRDGDEQIASKAIEADVTAYLPTDGRVPHDLPKQVTDAIEAVRPTERPRRASRSVPERQQFDRALLEAHDLLVDEDRSFTARIDAVLELGRETLGTEYATLSRVADAEYVFEAVAAPTDASLQAGERVPLGVTNCERVIETREPLVLPDVRASAPELASRAGNVELGIASYLGVPVFVDGRVTGTLCFYDTQARDEFTEEAVSFVERLGSWIAHEITRRRQTNQLTAIETAFPDLGFQLDDDGRYLDCFVSPATADLLYADPEEFLGQQIHDVLPAETAETVLTAIQDAIEGGHLETIEYELSVPEGSRWFEARIAPVTATEYGGESAVLVARDITERKTREDELATAEVMFQNAQDGLFLIDVTDDADFRIQRVNQTYEDLTGYSAAALEGRTPDELVGEDAGAEIVARYRRCVEREAPLEYEESLPIPGTSTHWQTKIAPIVDDGTVTKLVGATRDITEQKERESALKQQRQELAKLHRINTLIRGITQALQNTKTRTAIETAVCDHLIEPDLYRAAWIGTKGEEAANEETVVPQTVAGDSQAAGDEIPSEDRLAAEKALHSGEIEVADGGDSTPAGARYQRKQTQPDDSLVAIPLATGGTTYGVLSVYAPLEHRVTEQEKDVLTDLGQIIALAIQRVQSQRSLTAETAVELRLQVPDSGSLFGDVSRQLDCELALERRIPIDGERGLQYVSVRDAAPSTVLEQLTAAPFIDTGTVVRDTAETADQPALIEIRICDTNRSIISTLADHGASITSANAVGGDTYITVELTPENDVRTLVAALQEVVPTIELLGKQVLDQPTKTIPEIKRQVSDRLTTKQRAALSTAYTRGYFAWPRESTAEEVAQTMDIASSTFHFHLRHALDNLLTSFFESNCQ